jgi:hypothetical protein
MSRSDVPSPRCDAQARDPSLRQHPPQTLGSARICICFACFVRTRSGDGAAYGCLFQPACRDLFVIDNIIMNSVRHNTARLWALFYNNARLWHPALIDDETWTAVRDRLAVNAGDHRHRGRAAEPSLLAGLLVDAQGQRLTPSQAVKNSRRYRYKCTRHRDAQLIRAATSAPDKSATQNSPTFGRSPRRGP